MKWNPLVDLRQNVSLLTAYPGGPPNQGDCVSAWESLTGWCWTPPTGPSSSPYYDALGLYTAGEQRCLAGYPASIPGNAIRPNSRFDIWVVGQVGDDTSIWIGHENLLQPYLRIGPYGSELCNCGGTTAVGPGIGPMVKNLIRWSERDVWVYGQNVQPHNTTLTNSDIIFNTLLAANAYTSFSGGGVYVKAFRIDYYAPGTDEADRIVHRKTIETELMRLM